MKAADEPAYLTVGTDVSAKYRGAFCEAKIKTVKRMVKVKVNLKGESTSQVVQDDQIKGPLRVGSTVEVKTNEGISSEAVISKLTDASLYTVVFDDGDEKTLRRTSLCLKGERHFAESETLDQLPLTNPEHFGTPVIGKKSNRGGRRSSQAVADEENESSSSEDEEDDRRRLNDELLGKVCSIENEEPSSWYLALVVSPSCHDELVVKKDQCLVRAFSDCKFYTVARRHVHTVSSISISEYSCRRGFEAAEEFLKTGEVPDVWKMDMSQILDSSSSDDEDDEDEKESDEDEEDEDEKKKKKHIKEEPEEEPDPEERDHFLQQLYKFMEDRGTPINKPPVLGYKDLNLFKLFRLVYHHGGCHKIESGTVWKQVYMDLGIPVLNSAASYNVKTAYKKYLYGFEEYCRSASITFRTIHHNNPRPPTTAANHKPPAAEIKEPSTPPMKAEAEDDKVEEAESESESEEEEEEVKERQLSPRGRRRCVGNQVKPDRESPSRPEKRGGGDSVEEQREVRRRSNRRMEDSEKGSEEEEEDEDDEEDEEGERRRGDGEDEEDGDSVTGTKVRVKYGRGKTQKIYEAHIKKTDVDNGEQFYLVHYYGWNVRYDEWVKADRIIWPAEKGTKKRQRKKVKNKDEVERDRDKEEEKPPSLPVGKPPGGKRGRPQIRTTPTGSAGRSVSKTPSTEGRSNGKRTETPSSMANGDNTPRRRTRRTSGMYDSDRASNEDSGNSSEDSETEDPPDKKPSPWRGRTEAPPCQKEKEKEEEVKEDTNEVASVTTTASENDSAVAAAIASQLPVAAAPASPSTPPKTDKLLSQSEKEEAEQREEPAVEAAMLLVQLDKEEKTSPERVMKTLSVQETDKTSPSRASPLPDNNLPPEEQLSSPQPVPAEEEDSRSTPLSSPRSKGRRALLREAGSETPPRIPLCTPAPTASPSHVASPPRGVLKRQDEPMVVLHFLPTQHLPPESPAADSDTDSATEEEQEEEEGRLSEERSSSTLKRKAAEQRAADKKLRPDRRQEEAASPKTSPAPPKMNLSSPLRRGESERRSEGVMKTEEWPRPMEETPRKVSEERLMGGATKESEVHTGTPTPAPEAPGPSPAEELEIGPDALVCHEVDLDDPDEKEKPSTAPEHLLLMMRESQPAPPPLPSLLHASLPSPHTPHLPQPQLRPFMPVTTPSAASCPEELHPARSAAEEERGVTRGEQEGDSSPGFDGSASSSSTSLLSLQDTKDRGQKRVMDCNSSPTAKKQKRNQKRPNTPGKVEKNGAGHSSDSEDQSRLSLSQKSHKSRCPGLSSPSSHSKDKHNFSPQRTYKWTFQIDELDSMSSTERISFLQEKLQEIRKYYMTLKSEVASIDRRRKRLKKKEREVSNTTASTSSGSSDTGMSPSSASPTQNTVAVECR
ncbi:AT-rich interactive domain-containing protein 4A [Epinephelus lanceolatus]